MAKLRNTTAWDQDLSCFSVPRLFAFHVVILIAVKHTDVRITCTRPVFIKDLSLDDGVPRLNIDVLVSANISCIADLRKMALYRMLARSCSSLVPCLLRIKSFASLSARVVASRVTALYSFLLS